MAALQRLAARPLGRKQLFTVRQRLGRRFAHDEHGHGHAASTNEPLGAAFWIFAAAVPVSIAVYTASQPSAAGEPTRLTKLLDKWGDIREQNAIRNAMHTRLVEQAGQDRNLFLNTRIGEGYYELRFPENMIAHSPRAVHAGSTVDLSRVMARYRDEYEREETEKLRRLENAKAQ